MNTPRIPQRNGNGILIILEDGLISRIHIKRWTRVIWNLFCGFLRAYMKND